MLNSIKIISYCFFLIFILYSVSFPQYKPDVDHEFEKFFVYGPTNTKIDNNIFKHLKLSSNDLNKSFSCAYKKTFNLVYITL